jgi:hypothetical protein
MLVAAKRQKATGDMSSERYILDVDWELVGQGAIGGAGVGATIGGGFGATAGGIGAGPGAVEGAIYGALIGGLLGGGVKIHKRVD